MAYVEFTPRAEVGTRTGNSAVNAQDGSIIDIGGLAPASGGRLRAGNFRIRFPVRIKLLLAVFALLTITVAAITAFMALMTGWMASIVFRKD